MESKEVQLETLCRRLNSLVHQPKEQWSTDAWLTECEEIVDQLDALLFDGLVAKTVASHSSEVRSVYLYWVNRMGKDPGRTRLTPERRRLIQARLRDGYSVEELKAAIDGCYASDFHMARGRYAGGDKFNDLTLILRNGSKTEDFRDRKNTDPEKGAFL